MTLIVPEYVELDQQLDALDEALSAIERKRDQLHEDAMQFLLEARAARMEMASENKNKHGKETETEPNDGEGQEKEEPPSK